MPEVDSLDLAVVVTGTVADIELTLGALLGLIRKHHVDTAELVADTADRVVGQQILGAQLVADLAEGIVELGQRGGVVVTCLRYRARAGSGHVRRPCHVRHRPRWAP